MPTGDPVATPHALILLANLGRPRRPAGATTPITEPVLTDPRGASAQLATVLDRPVAAADLPDLRSLQRAAGRAAEAVLADEPVDCAEINAMAAGASAHVELVADGSTLRQRLVWTDASPAAALARRLVEELSGLDPGRMRRCARSECDLLFYDSTRSRTRRWHADDPCGWRERQRVHRARRS